MHSSVNPKNTSNKKLENEYFDTVNMFIRTGTPPDVNDIQCYDVNTPIDFPEITAATAASPSAEAVSKSVIEVSGEDVMDMTERYLSEELNPTFLVFASYIIPGGGATKGGTGQEEDVWRRTNMFQYVNVNTVAYPLKEIVYSPVYVLKNKDYTYKAEPFSTRCIVAAAVRWPKVKIVESEERFEEPQHTSKIKMSICNILKIAALNGHDSIVLGAWGCGAYNGPRHEIAEIFKECIEMTSSQLNFKKIGFAISGMSPRKSQTRNIFRNILIEYNKIPKTLPIKRRNEKYHYRKYKTPQR